MAPFRGGKYVFLLEAQTHAPGGEPLYHSFSTGFGHSPYIKRQPGREPTMNADNVSLRKGYGLYTGQHWSPYPTQNKRNARDGWKQP